MQSGEDHDPQRRDHLRQLAVTPTSGCLQRAPLPMSGRGDARLTRECLPAATCGRVEEGRDVCGVGDEGRDAFAQEPVRAGAGGTGYRAGHGADRASELRSAGGDVEGAGAIAGLHDDGCTGEGTEDAIAGEETPLGRRGAGRHLTGEQAEVSDSCQQLTIAGWVEAIQAADHDGEGLPACGECGSVCGGVDAVGAAGHDDPLGMRQVGDELARDVLAVACGSAGSGDRHAITQRRGEERGRAAHPQGSRGTVAQVIQGGRPIVVAGDEDAQPETVGPGRCIII